MIARNLALLAALPIVVTAIGCTQNPDSKAAPASTTRPAAAPVAPADGVKLASLKLDGQTIEVGCGMCIYHMPGVQRCTTAAMVNGAPVLLEGAGAEGYAHAFCSEAQTATVSGSLENGKVALSAFKVIEKGASGG
jgi:hypothetical protein